MSSLIKFWLGVCFFSLGCGRWLQPQEDAKSEAEGNWGRAEQCAECFSLLCSHSSSKKETPCCHSSGRRRVILRNGQKIWLWQRLGCEVCGITSLEADKARLQILHHRSWLHYAWCLGCISKKMYNVYFEACRAGVEPLGNFATPLNSHFSAGKQTGLKAFWPEGSQVKSGQEVTHAAGCVLGAFVMPYFSVQFSLTVNIFNQPPAVLDPKSKNWSLGSVLGSICFNESTLDPLDVIRIGMHVFFCGKVCCIQRAAHCIQCVKPMHANASLERLLVVVPWLKDGTINGWSGLSLKSRCFQDVSEIFLSSRVLCRERVNVLLGLVLHPFATSAINGPVSIEPYMLANTTPEWHRFACHVICPMMLHNNVISCHIISYQYHIYYTFFRRTWHAKVQEVLEFWGPLSLRQAIGGSWAFSKAGELLCARVRGALFEALLRQDWRNLPQWTITVAVASNTPKKKANSHSRQWMHKM